MNTGADKDAPDAGPGWSVAPPLIAAGTVQFTALFLLRHQMEPNNWALFMAATTSVILPLGLALWFGFFRRRDKRGWWKIPIVLWPVSFLALFTGVAVPEEMPQPHDDVAFAMSTSDYWRAGVRIAVATLIVAEGPDDDGGASRPTGLASGDMREINRIDAEFARQMGEDGRAYEAGLVEAGYPDLLLSRNLRSPADLPAARQRLERVLALIDRFRARYAARIATVETRLGSVTPEAARADLQAGFRAARAPTRHRADQIWQLERDIAEAQRGMLDLLGSTRWRRDGERFVFQTPSDQTRFDALTADVNLARDDQSTWRVEIVQTMAGVSTGTIVAD